MRSSLFSLLDFLVVALIAGAMSFLFPLVERVRTHPQLIQQCALGFTLISPLIL